MAPPPLPVAAQDRAPDVDGGPVAGPSVHCAFRSGYFMPAAASAARTRGGVSGIVRSRTPVASKIAFPTAAAGGWFGGSPAPAAGVGVSRVTHSTPRHSRERGD